MIGKEQAVFIARENAIDHSWPFVEPLVVNVRKDWLGRIRSFEIETNAYSSGAKARFVVDAKTGGVISEAYKVR